MRTNRCQSWDDLDVGIFRQGLSSPFYNYAQWGKRKYATNSYNLKNQTENIKKEPSRNFRTEKYTPWNFF